jgi:crossover junction endodeoxyribonuclease RusA
MGSFELKFPAPDKMLNMNSQLHRYTRASRVKQWRTAAFYRAKEAGLRPQGPSIIRWTITFPTMRRRDPHNFFPTLKPIIDGLVDAGVWPDDTPEWVTTTEPTIEVLRHPLRVPHITICAHERNPS